MSNVLPSSDSRPGDRDDHEIRDALRNWPRTLRFCVIRLTDPRVTPVLLWLLFSRR